jgi:Ferritin-like domain
MATFSWAVNRLRVFLAMGEPPLEIVAYSSRLFFPFRLKQDTLNRALTIELTAINQYFCQARMCQNGGFRKLGNKHYEESMGEMKHAERLIDRILFLKGVPEIA